MNFKSRLTQVALYHVDIHSDIIMSALRPVADRSQIVDRSIKSITINSTNYLARQTRQLSMSVRATQSDINPSIAYLEKNF